MTDKESYSLRSATGELDGIYDTPLFTRSIGDHSIKATIQIQYALERSEFFMSIKISGS